MQSMWTLKHKILTISMTWKEIKDIILRKKRQNLNVIVFMLQRSKIISLKMIETKRSGVLKSKS